MAIVTEDHDARLIDGIETLSASGVFSLDEIGRTGWRVTSIARTGANYIDVAHELAGGIGAPGRAAGELTANVTNRGLEWRWKAPNAAFDFLEDDRSVSELFSFRANEIYRMTVEHGATGETRDFSIEIGIDGESNESFEVLVLGADGGRESLVADNLTASGLLRPDFASIGDALSGRVNYFDYDAILAYTNFPPEDPGQTSLLLQGFVDFFDGGVVLATYAFTTPFQIGGVRTSPFQPIGGITGPGYSPFGVGPGTGAGTPIGREIVPTAAGADDPIFRGIDLGLAAGAFVVNENYTRPRLDPSATLLATDENGAPLLARNARGDVIAANFFPRDFGDSNIGPNGESLLTPGELEFHQLLARSLYAVHPLFDAPSAFALTPVARAEAAAGVDHVVLEAEDAALSDAVLVVSGRGASGGRYVDFPAFDGPLEVSWTVAIGQAGIYAVDFIYALAGAAPRPLTVLIDGEPADVAAFLPTSGTDWAHWSPQTVLLELGAGPHTISLLTDAGRGLQNGANLDYMRISASPVDPASVLTPSSGVETIDGVDFVKHEAEAARLSDAFRFDAGRGASGGFFVDFPMTDEALTIAWSVEVAESGVYGVDFIYALPADKPARPLQLTVDGDAAAFLPFEGVGDGWLDWTPESVALHLDAGFHVIALTSPSGAGNGNGANLDYMRISAAVLQDIEAHRSDVDALLL